MRLKTIFFTVFLFFHFYSSSALARINLIRDAQTEKFLRDLCYPVLKAANFNPENISIYIVNDNSLNAFVTGGQNIFIHTGLIRKYKTPNALIGVVAHEVGHIAGGHIARSSEEMKKAGNTMLLSYLLGIGAAIAGSPEAAQGIILGGNNVAEKLYLKYNRGQEEAADRHALKYLEKMNYPANGLINLLEFFQSQMVGYKGQINEYALSHPISSKRIDYLKSNVTYQGSDKKINDSLQGQMTRISTKLEAFIENPNEVLAKYRFQNNENANYAKSIALYRQGKISESLEILDEIIKSNSYDGFLFELKAQILHESGDIKNAIINYKKSIELLENRDSSQIRIYFASAILSLKSRDVVLNKLAIKNLKIAEKFEKTSPLLYKNLAIAFNNIDDLGRSFAALAEYNYLIGDVTKSKKYIEKAESELEKEKSAKIDLLRLEDLAQLIKIQEKESK